MKGIEKIQDLHFETSSSLDNLIELIRGVSRIHDLLDFLLICTDFAEANIPHQIIDDWYQSNPIFVELIRRSKEAYQASPRNGVLQITSTEITAESAIADTYSLILNNISHKDGESEKEGFLTISTRYNQLINGDAERKEIHSFLYRLNPLAASKFIEGSSNLLAQSSNDGSPNPLISLRSALNISIRTLMDLTGEATVPKQTEIIPRLSKYFGKDPIAQVDINIRNRNFLLLWIKLSRTKDMTIGNDQALGMALEIISILNFISRTVKLPRGM
jgi:hypothetical protein